MIKTILLASIMGAIIVTGLIIIPAHDVLAKSKKKILKKFSKNTAELLNRIEASKVLFAAGCTASQYAADMTPMVWTCPKGADVNDTLSEFYPDSSVVWR